MKIKRILSFTACFILLLTSVLCASQAADILYPAKVKDISDRKYESAVIDLLDNAKESIVMSMYVLRPHEKGPVRLLVRDLEEALDRGVTVEIYLNTRPDRGMPTGDDLTNPLQILIDKGAKVYRFTPHLRLHDKLIIVDSRYVVDGSMNWSVSAIKSNYESAVLIDSPELAKEKLLRLRNFPLEGTTRVDNSRPDRPKAFEPLPSDTVVPVKAVLLTNPRYLPAILKAQADRDMNAYLVLLAESARTRKNEFFVPLESLALTLGVSPDWTDTAMRRQMIKDLRALQDKYKLIDVDFHYAKDAWVSLKDLPGGTFNVGGAFFDPKKLISMSQPAKIVFLIDALLRSEGTSIEKISVRDLSERFRISQFSIRKGMRELKWE